MLFFLLKSPHLSEKCFFAKRRGTKKISSYYSLGDPFLSRREPGPKFWPLARIWRAIGCLRIKGGPAREPARATVILPYNGVKQRSAEPLCAGFWACVADMNGKRSGVSERSRATAQPLPALYTGTWGGRRERPRAKRAQRPRYGYAVDNRSEATRAKRALASERSAEPLDTPGIGGAGGRWAPLLYCLLVFFDLGIHQGSQDRREQDRQYNSGALTSLAIPYVPRRDTDSLALGPSGPRTRRGR